MDTSKKTEKKHKTPMSKGGSAGVKDVTNKPARSRYLQDSDNLLSNTDEDTLVNVNVQTSIDETGKTMLADVTVQREILDETPPPILEIQVPTDHDNVSNHLDDGTETKSDPKSTGKKKTRSLKHFSVGDNFSPRITRSKKKAAAGEVQRAVVVPKRATRTSVLVVVEEIEVPQTGVIYEDGLVWEENPAPPNPPVADKSILKKHEPSPIAIQDNSVDPPPNKRVKNIGFTSDPHHTRFFHSPKLLRNKTKQLKKRSKKTGSTSSESDVAIIEATQVETASVEATAAANTEHFEPSQASANPEEGEYSMVLQKSGERRLSSPPITPFSMDLLDFQFGGANNQMPNFGENEDSGGLDSVSEQHNVASTSRLSSTPNNKSNIKPDSKLQSKNTQNVESICSLSTQDILSTQSTNTCFVTASETGFYNEEPVCTDLIHNNEPINSSVLKEISHPKAEEALLEILQANGITTIGDLSKLNEMDLIKFPIASPRYKKTAEVLKKYAEKKQTSSESSSVVTAETRETAKPSLAELVSIVNNEIERMEGYPNSFSDDEIQAQICIILKTLEKKLSSDSRQNFLLGVFSNAFNWKV